MNAPTHILQQLQQDSRLGVVIARLSLPELPPPQNVFNSLLRSILGQQLSVRAAETIHQRFLNFFEGHTPTPHQLLVHQPETLRQLGLSRQKSQYLLNVADFFQSQQLLQQDWSLLSDSEIIDLLTQIKGVGKWTVEMVLIFTLHRPDVLPVDDLGIQQAFAKIYGLQLQQPKRTLYQEMQDIAAAWAPYRTYASRYLWQYKDQ